MGATGARPSLRPPRLSRADMMHNSGAWAPRGCGCSPTERLTDASLLLECCQAVPCPTAHRQPCGSFSSKAGFVPSPRRRQALSPLEAGRSQMGGTPPRFRPSSVLRGARLRRVPQDEDLFFGDMPHPHGEEAQSAAVSNHEARTNVRPHPIGPAASGHDGKRPARAVRGRRDRTSVTPTRTIRHLR